MTLSLSLALFSLWLSANHNPDLSLSSKSVMMLHQDPYLLKTQISIDYLRLRLDYVQRKSTCMECYRNQIKVAVLPSIYKLLILLFLTVQFYMDAIS